MKQGRALEGKVAVVTGAGRGIGRAIAKAFAAEGASILCAARTRGELDEVCNAITSDGGRAIPVETDVTNHAQVSASFDLATTVFGGVDIVVANAGISADPRGIEHSDPMAWKQTIEVNLLGGYHTIHAAVPHLRRRGAGNIIVIGSGMGHRSVAGSSAYCCSKAGLWMLTRALAQELRVHNILVNELIPGPVETRLGGVGASPTNPGENIEWVKQPKDVVPLALFLATLPSSGPTGQTFSLTRREL
ncbi:MAG TPA: SDR family oxidoreductase [Polyangia bacterium]